MRRPAQASWQWHRATERCDISLGSNELKQSGAKARFRLAYQLAIRGWTQSLQHFGFWVQSGVHAFWPASESGGAGHLKPMSRSEPQAVATLAGLAL